jgi:acyl carrier protein
MTTATVAPSMTLHEVEELVLELVGALLHESVADLKTRLVADGPGMPIDSLDLFDVVSDFRAKTGLKLPPRKMKRATMRSVRAFAEFVVAEASS